MTHVTITVLREGEEQYPILRTMDYRDKEEARADAKGIAEFLENYVI